MKQNKRIRSDPKMIQQAQEVNPEIPTWETMMFNELPDIAKDVKNSLHQEQKSIKTAKYEL
eukprot:578354-Ditylum_brightwellii.AAC.1